MTDANEQSYVRYVCTFILINTPTYAHLLEPYTLRHSSDIISLSTFRGSILDIGYWQSKLK
jgi:hypothetical protein